jgi:hypothetical protein
MKTPVATVQPGMGMGPYHGWCMAVPGDPIGRRLDLRVPSTYRPVDREKVKQAVQEP